MNLKSGGFSIPQTADRDDLYSILACDGHISSGDDHQQIRFPQRVQRFLLVVFFHQFLDFQQMIGSQFDLTAPQLEFNQGVTAVFQGQDRICFQVITVMVVGDSSVK